MTLDDIIYHFRILAGDAVNNPYMWSTELVESYADLAEEEACSRKPLLTSSIIEDLCKISVLANTATYVKHTKVRQIYKAVLRNESDTLELQLTDITELNYIDPSWQSLTGQPKYLVLDDATVTIVPAPEDNFDLWFTLSHAPIVALSVKQEPSVDAAHHYMLIFYMLHLAYSKRDSDTENPAKAAEFENTFSMYFGVRQDANATKSVRQVRETNRPNGWI